MPNHTDYDQSLVIFLTDAEKGIVDVVYRPLTLGKLCAPAESQLRNGIYNLMYRLDSRNLGGGRVRYRDEY